MVKRIRVVAGFILGFWLGGTAAATAACQHPPPSGGAWRALWANQKTGASVMQNEWQYECAKEPNSGQFGNAKRYLSVCDSGLFPGFIVAQCYGGIDQERQANPTPGFQPAQIEDPFDPNDPKNCYSLSGGPLPWRGLIDRGRNCLHAQFDTPYIPEAPGSPVYQGALERAVAPGYCIDVPSGKLDEGAQLLVYECHNGPNQQLRLTFGKRGQIVVMPGSNGSRGSPMCLDYYPSAGGPNDPVKIWPCHPVYTGIRDSQIWFPDYKQLRSNTGRCLAPDRNGRAYLVLANCPETGGQPTAYDWVPHHATYHLQSQSSSSVPALKPPPALAVPKLPPAPKPLPPPALPPVPEAR